MIIKSGKNMRGRYFMLLSCVLIANALLIYDVFDWLKNTTDAILAVLLVNIFVYFLLVSYGIAIFRTLVFGPQGCEVNFLCFSKFYTWDDFKVKRIEQTSIEWKMPQNYARSAVFAVEEHDRPKRTLPEDYYPFFAPWSVIFVKFYDSNPKPKEVYDFYVVDESLFREKMAEWGVELEEVRF